MQSNFIGFTLAIMLGAAVGPVSAAESNPGLTTQSARMDRYAASGGQTAVTSKTAADFSSFYGQNNAQALAGGLRNGSEISLTTQAPDGTTSTATFTPPTGSMGNGNVYISMALAQQRLTTAGITQPTAQQIQAAMAGGPLTPGGQPVDGVLQMRASGMGWGQIAHSLGAKLGHVVSGMKSANVALSRSTTVQTRTINATAAGKMDTAKPKASTATGRSGVVTAGGSGGTNVAGSKASGGKSGIVTGAGTGTADGMSSAGGAGKSQAHGAGVVSGGGGGQGNAYGKGGK